MQCQCSKVIEEQARRIQLLEKVLANFNVCLCDSCQTYDQYDSFKSCLLCGTEHCKECVVRCKVCCNFYCPSCSKLESSGENSFHLQTCDSCQQAKCMKYSCSFCESGVCSDCVQQCEECDGEFCLSCFQSDICSEPVRMCKQCHFKTHTSCYKPEDFKYLPVLQKSQIKNLLLVFTRVKDIIIPPRYVRDIIFRHLIQKNHKNSSNTGFDRSKSIAS